MVHSIYLYDSMPRPELQDTCQRHLLALKCPRLLLRLFAQGLHQYKAGGSGSLTLFFADNALAET